MVLFFVFFLLIWDLNQFKSWNGFETQLFMSYHKNIDACMDVHCSNGCAESYGCVRILSKGASILASITG